MKKGDKSGQALYFASVMLIFIGFAFFGIFVMQYTPLTGKTIDDVSLPSTCSDTAIQAVWDSIFDESSTGISIIKNDSILDGRCVEYFANKSDANEINNTFLLYGYTKEIAGENVTFVMAEKFNATDSYKTLLDSTLAIEDVDSLIVRDASFLSNYVHPRGDNITLAVDAETEFLSLFFTDSVSLDLDSFFDYEGFFYNSNRNTSTENLSSSGVVIGNYSYSFFSLTSVPIIVEEVSCTSNVTCGNWSDCINETETRICTDANDCVDDFNETRSCVLLLSSNLTCVPDWEIGKWSDCIGGLQMRTVVDLNSCSNETNKPVLNQTCIEEEICIPNWVCATWEPTECPEEGKQQRTCTDDNACDSKNPTKTEERNCSYEKSSNWMIILIILFVVGLILVVLLLVLRMVKKKEDEKEASEKAAEPLSKPPVTPSVKGVVEPARKVMPYPAVATRPKPFVSKLLRPKLTKPSVKTPPFPKPAPKTIPKSTIPPVKKPAPKTIPKSAIPPVTTPLATPVKKPASKTIPKSPTTPVKKPALTKTKPSIKSELEKIANPKK